MLSKYTPCSPNKTFNGSPAQMKVFIIGLFGLTTLSKLLQKEMFVTIIEKKICGNCDK